jgi:indolepyruvate ferredoxin oxidoreductase alpha subunit
MSSTQEECVTGDVAFAYGALAAGVGLVTGYPGSPSSGTLEALLTMPEAAAVHISWTINELIAMEMVTGASIAGRRALLCVKSVGLNIALDPLMTMVLTGNRAGLVILLGDDPGSWASQNEQDTRLLAILANIPLLEPATPQEAHDFMRLAFDLSERYGTPVIVREIRALALARGPVRRAPAQPPHVLPYVREPDRWISWPSNVVENHRRLSATLEQIRVEFEGSDLNPVEGTGPLGIVAGGAAYTKLMDTMGDGLLSRCRVLKLATFNPLPVDSVGRFLSEVETALVFEENEPYIERSLSALAHRAGLAVTILGRESGHVPIGGELDAAQIAAALGKLLPDLASGRERAPQSRAMPSQTPLCPDCPYIPLFETLLLCIDDIGGRARTITVGDPGCMVRACREPFNLLDVKYSLGASIGLAVGLAVCEPGPKVVAVAGDSAFLHHSWGGLVEAVRNQTDLLVLLLDNGTTALSGCQPHAGTPYDARQAAAPSLDLERLVRAAGVESVAIVDPFDRAATQAAVRAALSHRGLDVIISRSPCARLGEPQRHGE